jgi:hypothetical protein
MKPASEIMFTFVTALIFASHVCALLLRFGERKVEVLQTVSLRWSVRLCNPYRQRSWRRSEQVRQNAIRESNMEGLCVPSQTKKQNQEDLILLSELGVERGFIFSRVSFY